MFSSAVPRLALTFALVVLFSHFARAAPAPFDYATLLKNGQEAQRLNAEYMTLSADDTCVELQKGCVGDVPAQCVGGNWSLATTGCPDSQHCFALPSVRQSGTFVACTSEADAFSIIAATGAEGGVIAHANSSQGETSSSAPSATGPSRSSSATASRSPTSSSSSSTAAASTPTGSSSAPSPSSAAASSSPGPVVVTKTMTLAPGSTMSLSPTTITLAQASASAVLSSLLANGASIVSVIRATPSPSTSA